ncbi:NADH dehydrogenase (ubiquinone) 1 alpha subcomplex assembly factor 6 [Azospirillaceae bacterium]
MSLVRVGALRVPSLSYCGELVRVHDRDRFLTCLFAPLDCREDIYALYALNHEVAKTREIVSQPIMGQIRLQWWRDAIDALYENDGSVSSHQELLGALLVAIGRHGLKQDYFHRLLDARERDLQDDFIETIDDLIDYVDATSGNLCLLALQILGVQGEEVENAGRVLGMTWGLMGLLRAVSFHARARRLYLPKEVMVRRGGDAEDVFAQKFTPALAAVVQEIAEAIRERLSRVDRMQRDLPKTMRPVLLLAVLIRKYLARLERCGYNVFDSNFQEPLHLAPWFLLWGGLIKKY